MKNMSEKEQTPENPPRKDEKEMVEMITEDLNRLTLHELGRVYKFIRTKIIANL